MEQNNQPPSNPTIRSAEEMYLKAKETLKHAPHLTNKEVYLAAMEEYASQPKALTDVSEGEIEAKYIEWAKSENDGESNYPFMAGAKWMQKRLQSHQPTQASQGGRDEYSKGYLQGINDSATKPLHQEIERLKSSLNSLREACKNLLVAYGIEDFDFHHKQATGKSIIIPISEAMANLSLTDGQVKE